MPKAEARAALAAAAVTVAAVAIASCGARSSLVASGDGTAGTGGRATSASVSASSAGAGAAGAGGSGGAGGAACSVGGGSLGDAPVVTGCSAVAAASQVMTLVGGADEDDDQPSPVLVAYGPPGVSVVFAAHPQGADSAARVTTFDAWSAWPPIAQPSWPIKKASGPTPGIRLLATGTAAAGERQFALMYETQEHLDVESHYVASVFPCGSQNPDVVKISGPPGIPVSFVAGPAGNGFLGAISRLDKQTGAYDLDFSFQFGTDLLRNLVVKACATTPVLAGATATPTGWLIAAAGGTPFDGGALGCNTAAGPIGPTTFLTFANLDTSGAIGANGTLEAADTIESLVLVPTAAGARAVWAVSDAGASTAAIDTTAAVLTAGDLDMGAAKIGAKNLDAAPLGGNFAVAASTAKGIHVALFDDQAALLSFADVATPGTVEGVRVLASPAEDALLVVWTERAPGAANRAIRAARIDCM